MVNGKIAVLYNPRLWGGWSTWANAKYKETMMFDARLVKAHLDNNITEFYDLCKELLPGCYTGGRDGLSVEWITQGRLFKINVNNGSESIEYFGSDSYFVA